MTKRLLILGAYGVFGARLARAMAGRPGWQVIVAGRSAGPARALADEIGAEVAVIDRDGLDIERRIAGLAPFAVVDAAGPFQAYGHDPYRLVRACLKAGAHYLDLSDDAGFAAGIATLDDLARRRGLVALSGMSSVPALSSAVVSHLAQGITDLHLIDSAILPGNGAPRGLSVVTAILSQAGRPLRIWQAGRGQRAVAWGWPVRIALFDRERPRPASLIGAPDLDLFPAHFRARSVIFRAGLELWLLHLGLWLLTLPVRAGLVRSLAPLAPMARRAADVFLPLGTDRGGMVVEVAGLDGDGWPVRRRWQLTAAAGDGPEVPTLPARVALARLAEGRIAPGARPALGAVSLEDCLAEVLAAGLAITTDEAEAPVILLFQAALGAGWQALPPPLRALHQVLHVRRWVGRARVERGTGRLARLAAWLMHFPPQTEDCPVEVTMARHGWGEV